MPEPNRKRKNRLRVSNVALLQYNAIQLYCLYVEKFAFWLVIYINKIKNIQYSYWSFSSDIMSLKGLRALFVVPGPSVTASSRSLHAHALHAV